MAYADIAALVVDQDFARRTAACYATETLTVDGADEPSVWQSQHSWEMAAQPGFGDAYAYALNSDPPVERPGNDSAVITDGQILAAVQALLTQPEA